MKNIRSRIAALICAAAMAVGLSACGVNITSVGLPSTATMNKGDTLQLEISYGTENEAEADAIAEAAEKLDLVWTSSDEAVATVDGDGLVTAVGVGTAEIKVSAADVNLSSSCLVTVVVPATGITAPEQLNLVLNGQNTASLNAMATPEDATDVVLTYASSDEKVATVDETGMVTAVGNGEADITISLTQTFPASTGETATAETSSQPVALTATTHVTVTTAVESISFDKTEGVLTVGNTHQIKATVSPENASDQTLTWTSSDESIATVDSSGNVAAKAAGSATITASVGDVSEDYSLTVQNIKCSYCGKTGHTSSSCPVKAADQKAAVQKAAAQQQAAAQAAQQQAAASGGSSAPAPSGDSGSSGGSAAPAPAPAPAPSGDSGSSGGSSGGSDNGYIIDPNATQGSGTDWTQNDAGSGGVVR